MLKVAVITGGHHFDIIAFHQLFRALPGVDAYFQHMADFVASPPDVRAQYDVLVFYTFLHHEMEELGLSPGRDDTFHSVLESLGNTPQGIVVLHHSLLAFPEWEIWDAVVGIPQRTLGGYQHGVAIRYHLTDPEHPICAGLSDWTMIDETYDMPAATGDDNHILLTTDHERCLSTLAWTHQHKQSRVFCLQAGHDAATWQNANFRTLLSQGIQWCADNTST